jgi:TolA-binding protein
MSVLILNLTGCLKTRTDIGEEENKRSVQQQVSKLQKTNADTESRFSEMNDEIRSLNGKVESLEHKIQTNGQSRDKSQGQLEQQLAETNKRLLAVQEELQKVQSQVKMLGEELLKMGSVQAASAAVDGEAGKKTDILKLAESSFAKKNWRDAATYFEKYRETHPNGKKYGEATLKIGIAFQELGMKDDAKTFFSDVIEKYPNTPIAKQAKDRLKKK